MATINLYLDKPNSSQATMVFLRVFINGKRLKVSTGERILPKDWNKERQEVRKCHPHYLELNEFFKTKKYELEKKILNAKTNDIEVTSDFLKKSIGQKVNNENQFSEVFDLFLRASDGTKSKSTLKNYKTTYKVLMDYSKAHSSKLSFENLSLEFYDRFVHYLINNKGMMNNTVGNYIKHLKTFLGYAYERGYCRNLDYKKFKVFKEDSQQIALSVKELQNICELGLGNLPKLENVRDLFMVQCFTGLRFSDMIQIGKEHVKDGFLKLPINKTRDFLTIPILPIIDPIIEKISSGKIRTITNQKMNAYLKEVGWRANIIDNFEHVYYQGGKRQIQVMPKYEMISTHTGRRTFITLSLEKGIRPEVLKKLTGHRESSSFNKYIKITDKALQDELFRVWGNFLK